MVIVIVILSRKLYHSLCSVPPHDTASNILLSMLGPKVEGATVGNPVLSDNDFVTSKGEQGDKKNQEHFATL